MERPDAPNDALRTLYAMGRKLRGEDVAPTRRATGEVDLYATAATPVNPMPERAGPLFTEGYLNDRFMAGERPDYSVPSAGLPPVSGRTVSVKSMFTLALERAEHAARAEAKAQRVADETDEVEVISDASELWDALVAAGVTRIVVDSEKFDQFVALLAEPEPTDDHPTLPATALRTWEG